MTRESADTFAAMPSNVENNHRSYSAERVRLGTIKTEGWDTTCYEDYYPLLVRKTCESSHPRLRSLNLSIPGARSRAA
jgi:hypothetical protein